MVGVVVQIDEGRAGKFFNADTENMPAEKIKRVDPRAGYSTCSHRPTRAVVAVPRLKQCCPRVRSVLGGSAEPQRIRVVYILLPLFLLSDSTYSNNAFPSSR